MDKIPGFLIPGSWALNYPGIKKSRDWNFQKIPGVKDWKDPGILASLVLGAKYLSYVKFIATRAPTFFGYIISVLANVPNEKLVQLNWLSMGCNLFLCEEIMVFRLFNLISYCMLFFLFSDQKIFSKLQRINELFIIYVWLVLSKRVI